MFKKNKSNQTLCESNHFDKSRALNRCLICFQDVYEQITFFEWWKQASPICSTCIDKFEKAQKIHFADIQIEVIYIYNDFLEQLLYQYKEQHDIALKDIFLAEYIKVLKRKYKHYTIVYMPSSKEKIEERGFFPLQEIFENLNLKHIDILEKTQNVKQSLLTLKQRKKIKNYMRRKEGMVIPKKILLVDDVITSGSSFLAAKELLEEDGIEIRGLVICSNAAFVEKNRMK